MINKKYWKFTHESIKQSITDFKKDKISDNDVKILSKLSAMGQVNQYVWNGEGVFEFEVPEHLQKYFTL